jgi:hypothetical protein
MAKALFGHVGAGADPQLLAELRGLRRKVGQLETELARVRAANEALMASVTVDDDIRLLTEEPALT